MKDLKTLPNHNDSKNFTYLHTVVKDNLAKLAVITSLETQEKNDKIDLTEITQINTISGA